MPVGGLVMVMEDIEAPHHMLLLRYFMAQGLVHSQPLFFTSPLPSPQAFLGLLPAVATVRESKSQTSDPKDMSGQVNLESQLKIGAIFESLQVLLNCCSVVRFNLDWNNMYMVHYSELNQEHSGTYRWFCKSFFLYSHVCF